MTDVKVEVYARVRPYLDGRRRDGSPRAQAVLEACDESGAAFKRWFYRTERDAIYAKRRWLLGRDERPEGWLYQDDQSSWMVDYGRSLTRNWGT